MNAQAIRARLAAGCYLPEAREHALLLLRIAERRESTKPQHLPPMLTTRHASRETIRTFGTTLLIAVVCLWLGYALGAA